MLIRCLRHTLSVLVCAPLLALAAPAPVNAVEGITEYRLPNGLQVLLAPDDSKPTTTVNLTYRVGSRHESYGETGMAHLLEHLLFKGTPRHRNVWAEFNKRGLRANGSTWLDRTNYFASFAASDANMAWYLDWLADSMTHSFIARADLDSEMTVVRNEMEMGENNPDRILFEKTLATMYQWHNYGHSTIGARADVEGVDIGRLQDFYRRYYQPDNATLIVSGKFDPARALSLIEQHFGKLKKPRRVLPALYTLEAVQDGERAVTLRRVGGTAQLVATYHTVPGAHPDQAALEVLALIMGEAPAGRLHKRLTEAGLAASTWAWTTGLHDPGFIAFGAELAPGQNPDAAREALLATLESVSAEALTTAELMRAQTKWINAWEQQYSDPERVGVALSESVAQGDWRLLFLLRDRVRALTLADVQRVATERLLRANRTLGVYLPSEQPQRAPAPAKVDLAAQMKSFKPQAATQASEQFDATPAHIDARTQRSRLAAGASGVRLALLPKATRGQVVNAVLTLRVGDLASLQGQAEVATLLAAMLDKGTAQLDRQQVQDALDALRTELQFAFTEPGALSVSLKSRREHLPQALELVVGLLRQPALDAGVLEEIKRQQLTSIEALRKEPQAVLDEALARHGNAYPRGDIRHARSFDERVQDVRAVTPEALRAFHTRLMGAGQAEFAAVGDFDPAAVRASLERALSGWAAATPYTRVPQPFVALPPARLEFNTPDKQNASMLVRLPLPLSDQDADYAALTMANYLLGFGGNSRLWLRIRERDGLSYDVRSGVQWSTREPYSMWQASAIFAPGNRAKVEAAFKEEIERARRDGFSVSELEDGKRGLLSLRRLTRAQDPQLARILASYIDLDRTMATAAAVDEKLQSLTLDQVNAALRKYIEPQRFLIGVAGDFASR